MQPLHVFEQRYRDLLEDALAGDQLIAMAALAPAGRGTTRGGRRCIRWPALAGSPRHYRLADGTYNVLLLGLRRVKLVRELATARRFREAKVELCTDVYSACSPARRRALQQELRKALLQVLPTLPEAREQLDQLLGGDVPLGLLTDVVGYMLDIDIQCKQSLLAEVNVYRRVQLLLCHLSETVAELAANDAASLCFPPQFSAN